VRSSPPSTTTECDPPSDPACVRILFLGNSYTYVNDMPGMVHAMGRSAGRDVATLMVAAGGETLGQHAGDPASTDPIRSGRWAWVVLQEQSEIPAVETSRLQAMEPAARNLVGAAKSAGARPLLLETWAHRDGLPTAGLDVDSMQQALDAAYEAVGRDLATPVAPVGRAWQIVRETDPSISLWQDDGSHPATAGTYLAACVLIARILGVSPVGLGWTAGLPDDVARALQEAAASANAASTSAGVAAAP